MREIVANASDAVEIFNQRCGKHVGQTRNGEPDILDCSDLLLEREAATFKHYVVKCRPHLFVVALGWHEHFDQDTIHARFDFAGCSENTATIGATNLPLPFLLRLNARIKIDCLARRNFNPGVSRRTGTLRHFVGLSWQV